MNELVESKRYIVFSNDRGTRANKVEFSFPSSDSESPDDYLSPIGIAYEHPHEVYGDGLNRSLVGFYLLSDKGMGSLVGKILTIVDAMFTDAVQRKAFKDLMQQELYGFQRDQEERVRQTYQSLANQQ